MGFELTRLQQKEKPVMSAYSPADPSTSQISVVAPPTNTNPPLPDPTRSAISDLIPAVNPPPQTRLRLPLLKRFNHHRMEMIDRAVPLAEGTARSDASFDVANG